MSVQDSINIRKRFMGIPMSQNQLAVPTFDEFLNTISTPARRIIELGTYQGGLSLFLHISCYANDCHFVTYDSACRHLTHSKMFAKLNVDYRIKDIFTAEEEIAELIQLKGTTVLLCDNGNKIREFNMFSKYLKNGDYIMAHDYAVDRTQFNITIRGKFWDHCEIVYADIQKSVEQYGLIPFMSDEWQKAAWCCFFKKEIL